MRPPASTKGLNEPPGPQQAPDAVLEEVLRSLKEAQAPLSGESLAARLGLTRAAVWKRIQRLKSLGYAILGEPRRGYRLLNSPDKLWPGEILQGLRTRILRGPVHCFPTLASTNDLAKELGAKGAPEGTLVVAEAQTGGRGRLGRRWDSPPGVGLYASLLLRPSLPPLELPRITLTTAVAVVRALRRVIGLAVGIKWPNDLILQGKKVGGILTEMETETERIRYLVVGLGLNVNNPGFAAELAGGATSLAQAVGHPVRRLPLLQGWLEEFEVLYEGFLAGEFDRILREWQEYNVTLGRTVTVRQGLKQITGLALAVAPDGALLLQTETGEVMRVTSGELDPTVPNGGGAGSPGNA